MGRNSEGRKKRSGFGFFKILFSLIFLIITILWTLFVVSFIGVYSEGWEWAQNIPGVSALNNWLTTWIASHANNGLKVAGMYAFLIGIDVVLVYTTLFYPIQKIPFFGKLLRWITGIIPALGTLAIIIGVVLVWIIK